MKSIIELVKGNKGIKKFVHLMLVPSGEAVPRLWVKYFLNRFFHSRGRGSKIRRNTRRDLFPFNKFYLGKKSIIESYVTLNNGVGEVIIGDNVIIGIGSVLIGPIQIGNDVMLAQNIVCSGLNHNYEAPDIPISRQGTSIDKIVIEDEVWIGANSTITPGVKIGKHSIVGAGSVVTKEIPPYSIAVGNPARVVKHYNFESREWEKAVKTEK